MLQDLVRRRHRNQGIRLVIERTREQGIGKKEYRMWPGGRGMRCRWADEEDRQHFGRKHEDRRLLERPKHKWAGNIRVNIKEI